MLLWRLAGMSILPWLCLGDFNEILNLNKTKWAEMRKISSKVHEFRQVVRDCGLTNQGLNGYLFTWSNRRFGPHLIEE